MYKLALPILGLSLSLMATLGTAHAQVPSKVQAAIIYRILKYDKNVVDRSKAAISLVILLEGTAAERKDEIIAGFSSINGQKVESASIKIAAVTIAGADKLPAAMTAASGNLIYLPQGVTAATSAAAVAYGKANKVPVFSDDPVLSSQGVAVCIVLEGGSPKMVINLPASQAQGMALSADVLKLAKVIR
jgi:hypothetical protein